MHAFKQIDNDEAYSLRWPEQTNACGTCVVLSAKMTAVALHTHRSQTHQRHINTHKTHANCISTTRLRATVRVRPSVRSIVELSSDGGVWCYEHEQNSMNRVEDAGLSRRTKNQLNEFNAAGLTVASHHHHIHK